MLYCNFFPTTFSNLYFPYKSSNSSNFSHLTIYTSLCHFPSLVTIEISYFTFIFYLILFFNISYVIVFLAIWIQCLTHLSLLVFKALTPYWAWLPQPLPVLLCSVSAVPQGASPWKYYMIAGHTPEKCWKIFYSFQTHIC